MPAAVSHPRTARTRFAPAVRPRTAQDRRPPTVCRLPPMVRALGARQWAADGAEYLDVDQGGGAIPLGHADPAVMAAQRSAEAAETGRLRTALAERLTAITPHAEQAVLTSSFPAALSGALAAARRHTARPLVLSCDNCRGAEAFQGAFPFGDLSILEGLLAANDGQVAAVLLAAIDLDPAPAGYLAEVRRLADRHGALMILDERTTALRAHHGGAQGLTGVRADLAVFGDSLANGAAFGAVAGPKDVLAALPAVPERLAVEPPTLAAALAVLGRAADYNLPAALRVLGAELQAEIAAAIEDAGLASAVRIAGDPSAPALAFSSCGGLEAEQLKAFWLAEAAAARIICHGAFNICLVHDEADLGVLIEASARAAAALADVLAAGQFPTFPKMVQ